MIGLAILGLIIAFLVWASVDAFTRYGLFAGLVVAIGAVASFFVPYVLWILIIGYPLCRLNAAPATKGGGAWIKELREMRRRRASGSSATDSSDHAIGAADKDTHLEELLAAGALTEALRYAKEKAAQALEAGDHRAAQVYEKYLERIRQGGR